MQSYQMLIGGRWVEASSGERITSADPYSGETWASLPRATAADAEAAVEAAHAAFLDPSWGALPPSRRAALMRKLADLVAEAAPSLAEIETRDNGKLLVATRAEVGGLANVLHYFAGLADKVEGVIAPPEMPGVFAYTRYQPVGVVAVITPWNSPLLIAAIKAANALAAGCTVVIKPSEFTSASTLEFAKLCERAGFPPGVVNVVTGYGSEVGEALVTHPKVAKIQFTGGTATGRRINELAAGSLKKVVLELGGKSPNIIFDDADMDAAVKGAIIGVFSSSGQSCITGSRLLLHRTIHDQFVERLVAATKDLRIGDPKLRETQIGPITTRPQFDRVLELIGVAKSDGAECAMGGGAVDGPGQLVRPTIFTGVRNDMRIAQEEVFGPVLSVIPFDDEDEAVSIGNDIRYGLAAGVWTSNTSRIFRMTERLQAGTVWVNTYRIISTLLPSTGYKESGLGSEGGQQNILNFMKPKTVYLNHGAPVTVPFMAAQT